MMFQLLVLSLRSLTSDRLEQTGMLCSLTYIAFHFPATVGFYVMKCLPLLDMLAYVFQVSIMVLIFTAKEHNENSYTKSEKSNKSIM